MIEHRRFILDEKVKMDELKLVGLEPGNVYLRMKNLTPFSAQLMTDYTVTLA